MQESPMHRHGLVLGVLMVCAAVLTAGFVFFPKGSILIAEASQACPFTDGDGGTPGIQVTGNTTVSAVPTAGDYYDCTASDVTIKNGVTVILDTDTTTGTYAEIHFTNVTIEPTAIVHSDVKGCFDTTSDANGYGPNTSTNICAYNITGAGGGSTSAGSGSGGSYGGRGGLGGWGFPLGNVYGAPEAPVLFGSSGGTAVGGVGGRGGGIVRFAVSGTFTHNGTMRANGGDGTLSSGYGSGGGSGGSIYITADTVNGTGTFEAKGGSGPDGSGNSDGGGGGGGQIAVMYNSLNFSANATSSFEATDFSTAGGAGGTPAGITGTKGSVYTSDDNGTTGTSADDVVTVFHGFHYSDTDYNVSSWTVDATATAQSCDATATTPSVTAPTVSLAGAISCSPTNLSNFTISSSTTVTMSSFTFTIPNQKFFYMSGGAAVTLSGTTTINANTQWTGLASLTIGSSSVLNASSFGCTDSTSDANGYGPNTSTNVCGYNLAGAGGGNTSAGSGSGGGYGGPGGLGGWGFSIGAVYGVPEAPVLFGSSGGTVVGGAGGAGGGVIRLDVVGTLTQNGILRTNGGDGVVASGYGSGGGSGGSIYITSATTNGTGTFEAKGGLGPDGSGNSDGGGGGGGQIAIIYDTLNFSANATSAFESSDFNVTGGSGGSPAGIAGTKGVVYTSDNNATTGTQSDDNVTVFHSFHYSDTDYVASSWTTDSSATTQSCDPGATTPSITAATFVLAGALSCSPTTPSDFTITASSTVTMSGFTFTVPAQKYFILSGGAAVTLSGSTVINANVLWTGIASLDVGSSSIVSANGLGCVDSGADDHGYGPNGSNVCTYNTAGAGKGNKAAGGTGSGGGGHGGAGGGDAWGNAGGTTTYDTAASPSLFGSSAGTGRSGTVGGAGGGRIRIEVSGTLTQSGITRANGIAGVNFQEIALGGGSGGAIYVTAGTVACSAANRFQAYGGDGGNNVSNNDGGGGGGGRIAIEYSVDSTSSSCAFNDGADTIGGSGASVYAAGGSGFTGGTSGSAGTLYLTNTNPPPAVTVVTHTPSNPTQADAVTLSGTATDGGGVTSIQIYLDGTAPANLKKTCTQAATSPVTCTVDVGVLSYGSHTTTIRASDGTNTTDGTETFTVGGPTQSGTAPLSRLQAGANSVFTLSFAFQSGTHSGPLTVTFPSAFTINSAAQGGSSSACLGSFAFDNTAKTLSATKTSCTGTITLGGASITNPGTPGSYTISWVNDDPGSTIVAIVDSDQVSMSASVDPFITANIGSQAAATACDGTFAGNGGTLALGSLSASTVTSSDASSVPHICIRVSTNAATGAVATVTSVNAALKSTSTPADTIDSATASPLATNTAGYGLCVGSAGGDTGRDATTPTGALPTAASPFNGTCTSAAHNIGALTTGAQNVFTLSSPTQNAFARIYLKAGISTTTKAHTDYGDTLTFIVTGTF